MSNNISELFKIFCSNEIFTKHLVNISSDTDQNFLLEQIMNDEEFISLATQFVEDKHIIENKVLVKLGQEMKKYNKPKNEIVEKKVEKEVIDKSNNENWNDPYRLMYISDDITLQLQKDNTMKMVTPNFTVYY